MPKQQVLRNQQKMKSATAQNPLKLQGFPQLRFDFQFIFPCATTKKSDKKS